MTNVVDDAVALEAAAEQLRQERETFNQRKAHEERWFSLRLRMGYASLILLPAIMAVSGVVLLNPTDYTSGTVTLAGAALFTDVLGLMAAVWKVVLNPASVTRLDPVTHATHSRVALAGEE